MDNSSRVSEDEVLVFQALNPERRPTTEGMMFVLRVARAWFFCTTYVGCLPFLKLSDATFDPFGSCSSLVLVDENTQH